MAIEYRVLGPLEVSSDGQTIDLPGSKQRLLLSLLLAHAGERVSAGRLIDSIWGDEPGDGAAHTLQVHVSNLRKLLEPEHKRGQTWTVIETLEDGYRLRVDDGSFDRDRFEHLAHEGHVLLEKGDDRAAANLLGEALDLWSGPAFGEAAGEEALQAEATRLEELRLTAIEDRVDADLGLGHHHDVIAELRDLVDAHPFRERLRGQLMVALYRAGRQADALRTYQSLVNTLGDELGIEPGQEIKRLEERILLQDPKLDLAPPTPSHRTNLPAATSSFVGRAREISETRELLRNTRLLTFIGPGGVGKTRLALEAAAGVVDQFPGGLWLVELAPLRDQALVGEAVAESLEIDQQPDRPIRATLVDQLRDSMLLLILDNCEHLIDATAALADTLLKGCPELRVWATSREPLGIAGEIQFLVSSLPVATDSEVHTEATYIEYDAIRLYVERASATLGGFRLSSENAPSVAQICRRLGGNPLAIELAAARARTLTPQEIAAGLDDRFHLLTTGSRTAGARQQTLQGALDWSYDLLTEVEQAMMRRLSVFRGTFGLDAVKAVCSGVDGGANTTLALLDQLVAKSLVMADPSGGEMRYELLETVRLYSRTKLAAAGEEEGTLAQHREWYTSFAEEAGPRLRGEDQLIWLQRLEDEHDNLRAVLERSHDVGDIETPLRIAGSIAWFWFLHSHLAEGWQRLGRLIAESDGVPDILRLRVLIAAGQFAWEQTKDEQAKLWLEEALALARRIKSRTHTGWALGYLALLATLEGRWEDGESLARKALEVFEAAGSLAGVGFSMWVKAAASYLHGRETKEPAAESIAGLMGSIEGMLEMAQQIGDRNFIGHLQWSLAIVAHDQGDDSGEAKYLAGALRAFHALGNKSCAGHTLDQVAWLALALGQPKRSARLLAATEALRSGLGIPGHLFERRMWDECRQRVTEALQVDQYDEAWRDGSAMDLRQAISYALSDLSAVAK